MHQLSCRLWPTAVKLSPAQLQPVAASTVTCFIDQGSAVFWIPSVTSAYGSGEWVKASQACFLPIDGNTATPQVADVARRAALKIPDLPKHASEVHLQRFCSQQFCIPWCIVAFYSRQRELVWSASCIQSGHTCFNAEHGGHQAMLLTTASLLHRICACYLCRSSVRL